MKSYIQNNYSQFLRREIKTPLPISAPKLNSTKINLSTTPKVAAASIPSMAGVVNLKIERVDPAKVALAKIPQREPANSTANKPQVRKIVFISKEAAMAATGALAFLTPALAFAGEGLVSSLSSWFSGLGMLGWVGATIGLVWTARLVLSKIRESWAASGTPGLSLNSVKKFFHTLITPEKLKPENYQSKNMQLNTENPTPRKLFKTLVLPAWLATVAIGGLFAYLPVIQGSPIILAAGLTGYLAYKLVTNAVRCIKTKNFSPRQLLKTFAAPVAGAAVMAGGVFPHLAGIRALLMQHPDFLSYGAFAALAFKPIITLASSWARDIRQWIHYKTKGIQRYMPKPNLAAQLITNASEPAAWLATLTFMVHLSKVYADQFTSMILHLPSSVMLTAGSSSALMAMGQYGIVFGLAAAAHRFIWSRPKAKIGNPLKELPPRLQSSLIRGALGAATGALIYLAGPGSVLVNLLTFTCTLAFAHSTIHSLRSQEGGIRQATKKQPLFDLQSLWETVRSAAGAVRTVFKPSIDMKDPLISSYVMALISEGANWVLNAITGAFSIGDYKIAQEMIEKLLQHDTLIMRTIIRKGREKMLTATTPQDAVNAVAEVFENLSLLFTQGKHPLAKGDLKSRSGIGYLADSTFCAGLPGSSVARSDQDLRVHGEHLRFATTLFREKAARLRKMNVSGRELQSVIDNLDEKLEAAFRRALIPMDSHPGRFYTNILFDSYNAKQFVIDLCFQVMADYVGFFDTVVMTPDGRIQMWAIPLKVVKDFKEDHEKIKAIESRDTLGEDLRFEWYERKAQDVGNSLCDIAYIDNSAHFRKYEKLNSGGQLHPDFLQVYPTFEKPQAPELKAERQYDPYLSAKQGIDVYEDQEFYDVVYKNGSRLRIFADGSQKAIEGAPPKKLALLMLPGTKRHDYIKRLIALNTEETVFGNITVNTELKAILAKGVVPHPFGGNFTDNKYTAPRWHFMYPTEYFSISDADQMDLIVTNLRLFHTRKNPHLRVMMIRPRTEELPYSPDMLEKPCDSLLEVGEAVVWMTMKITLDDGKTITIPLNKNKENERTFAGELWRYIDQEKEVILDKKRKLLKIPYIPNAKHDPAFREATQTGLILGGKYNNRESIEEVPIPFEMETLIDRIEKIEINPERYSEVGGPRPVVDYFFVRRKENGSITDFKRQLEMSERVANMIIFGKTSLLNQEEVEYWELVKKPDDPSSKENTPWVDDKDWVHMKMSDQEFAMLLPWLQKIAWQGRAKANLYENGELIIDVKHFELLADYAYSEFTYRRFMPDNKFRNWFDPNNVDFAK